MNKKQILIAPNSFKECKDSSGIAKLIYKNISDALHDLEIVSLPLSDGGDGFLECIKNSNKVFKVIYYNVKGYDYKIRRIPAVISEEVIYIESAKVIGLKLLPESLRDPLKHNTSPLGILLKKIDHDNRRGLIAIKQLVIGIGGTATNDLGLGLCSVFGLKIKDKNNNDLEVIPAEFRNAASIFWETQELSYRIQTVIDVDTPLTGDKGSAALFAKQKGADEKGVKILEEGFNNILRIIQKERIFKETEYLPGAGGGTAAGLLIFLKASVKTSRQFIGENLYLDKVPRTIDYVITGEGSFDLQSYYGKAAGIIINEFSTSKIFLICGTFMGNKMELPQNVRVLELIKYFKSQSESIQKVDEGIRQACKEIIREISAEV